MYFSQNEYIETVYIGQPAGTPVLQVHALRDNDSERPHFYLCWMNSLRRPAYISWFSLDVNTGVLYLNKTLEESDFASLCEPYTGSGTHSGIFCSFIYNIFMPLYKNIIHFLILLQFGLLSNPFHISCILTMFAFKFCSVHLFLLELITVLMFSGYLCVHIGTVFLI